MHVSVRVCLLHVPVMHRIQDDRTGPREFRFEREAKRITPLEFDCSYAIGIESLENSTRATNMNP